MCAEPARLPRSARPGSGSPRLTFRWARIWRIAFTLASLAVFVLGFAAEVPDAVPWGREPWVGIARPAPPGSPVAWPTGTVVVPAPERRSAPEAPAPAACRPAAGW